MAKVIEYKETQRFAPWVFLLLGAIALLLTFVSLGQMLVVGRPLDGKPVGNPSVGAMILLFGLGLPALLASMKLEIETTYDAVRVRFWPLINRTISYTDIESATARQYSPIKEYGGWGVRGWGKRVAYNASGNEGVLIKLKNGGSIMLGSQRMNELEAAIRSGMAVHHRANSS